MLSIGHFLGSVILFAGAWVMAFPFSWMIASSLRPKDEVYDTKFSIIPRTFKGFENDYEVLFD